MISSLSEIMVLKMSYVDSSKHSLDGIKVVASSSINPRIKTVDFCMISKSSIFLSLYLKAMMSSGDRYGRVDSSSFYFYFLFASENVLARS